MRVFHVSINWWSFTGIWVTTSLLKSPGFFSVFWPISTILWFGWSPIVHLFPSPPVLLQILWWAPITIGIIVTFIFQWFFNSTYPSVHFLTILLCRQLGQQTAQFGKFSIFQRLVVSKSQRSKWVSFSRTDAGLCIYHLLVWSNLNFFKILSGPSYPTRRIKIYTLSMVICSVPLLCDWSFCVYLHITYICCFVASYLLLLWYDRSLWRCFLQLLEYILFPS